MWSSDTRYKAADVIRHEEYNKPRMANDIAVVKIDGNIEINDKVSMIPYSKERVKKDTVAQFIGWGRFGVHIIIISNF